MPKLVDTPREGIQYSMYQQMCDGQLHLGYCGIYIVYISIDYGSHGILRGKLLGKGHCGGVWI